MKQFFDTNVLLYQFDASAERKRLIARECVEQALESNRFVISTQVMMEFYANATGKFARSISVASAQRIMLAWTQSGLVMTLTPQIIVDAASLRERHRISWWDANIVIAAQRAGASVLLTEDMQHGQVFDNLRVENPFIGMVKEPPVKPYLPRRKRRS